MLNAISLPPSSGQIRTQDYLACPMHGSMPAKSPPIQIPTKRRPNLTPLSSPRSQTISPDMIFEMSPVTSETPILSPFSLGHSSTANDVFVYKFPMFSSPKSYANANVHPIYGAPALDTRSLASAEYSSSKHLASQPKLDNQDLCFGTASRLSNTTKISGFLPMKGEFFATQLQDQNLPLPERLSPGPRRSSYSASPWILSGKGEDAVGDVAYSQADPSAFEYERQLLRRIQNQNRPRLSGLRSYM